jgi:hypothetical protein
MGFDSFDEVRHKRNIGTPRIAGQTPDGERWFAAAYPISDLVGYIPEYGHALDFIPFVEVYTTNGGKCCTVDMFAFRHYIDNPHAFPRPGYMVSTIVRVADKVDAAWGFSKSPNVARWAEDLPLDQLIHPNTPPLYLYRYETKGTPPPVLQAGWKKQGGWPAHAMSWIREVVPSLLSPFHKHEVRRFQGVRSTATLTPVGEFSYADVAQHFINMGKA